MAQIIAYDPDLSTSWDVVSSLGHDVTSFTDSGETIDFAQENKVDIALLSGSDGIDMIKYLREISEWNEDAAEHEKINTNTVYINNINFFGICSKMGRYD